MIGGFQFEDGAFVWLLNVSVHLEVQSLRILVYVATQPGEHRRQLGPLRLVLHLNYFLKILATQRAPDAPAKSLGRSDDGQLNAAANEIIFSIDNADILIEESCRKLSRSGFKPVYLVVLIIQEQSTWTSTSPSD